MNETPAAPAPLTPEDLAKRSKRRMRILFALCIVGAILLKLSFIFFCIGMLPAMVAYIVDHDRHKYTFSTVAALNFSGVLPYMIQLYLQGGTFDAVKHYLSDATVWFVMYGAAAVGWGIIWASPLIATMFLETLNRGRLMHLDGLQKKAEEEWGEEITGRSSQDI